MKHWAFLKSLDDPFEQSSNVTCLGPLKSHPNYAPRLSGALHMLDASNNMAFSHLLYGTGCGPQLSFQKPSRRPSGES